MREDITKSFRRGFSSKATVGNVEEYGSMSFLSGFGKRRSRMRSAKALPATSNLTWNPLGHKIVDTQALEKRILTLEGDVAVGRKGSESAVREIKALEGKVANRDAILRKRALIMQEQATRIAADEARVSQLEETVAKLEAVVAMQEEENSKLLKEGKLSEDTIKAAEERVQELENIVEKREEEMAIVKGTLVEKEETVFKTEKEVSNLKYQHRPKPVRAVVKTLVYVGTGALVAIASAGGR